MRLSMKPTLIFIMYIRSVIGVYLVRLYLRIGVRKIYRTLFLRLIIFITVLTSELQTRTHLFGYMSTKVKSRYLYLTNIRNPIRLLTSSQKS